MKKTIMVVDDNADVIMSVKHGIKDLDAGFDVISVESGQKCLDFLKNNPTPDLILLDIMMPEMTGWETFDKIKESDSWDNIPIIFLTARNDRIAENAGRFLGEDYIEKPFEIADLKKRIDKVLLDK